MGELLKVSLSPVSAGRNVALACLILFLFSRTVSADWSNFAKFDEMAELSIDRGWISLNLRLAGSIIPAGFDFDGKSPISPSAWLALRLPIIMASDGKPMKPSLQSFRRLADDPAAAQAKLGGDGNTIYEAVLRYSPIDNQEVLSIIPPEQGSVGLVLLHRGVPVSDMLPLRKLISLKLDWNNPWLSRFDDAAFVRQHAEPRSYVYLETYEVRHELLLRLKDIKPFLDWGAQGGHVVEESARQGLKQKVGEFLLTHNPLTIDGQVIMPQLDKVEFVRYDRSGIVPVGEQGRLDVETAVVGVILSYLTDKPARSIHLQWDLFGNDLKERRVSVIKAKETFETYMNVNQPFFDWSQDESLEPMPAAEEANLPTTLNTAESFEPESISFHALLILALFVGMFLLTFRPRLIKYGHVGIGLALLTLVGIGLTFHPLPDSLAEKRTSMPPRLDEPQVNALLQSLLHNAYRAFQLHDEEKTYDRLAISLDGEVLEDIYLQQRQAMLRQTAGLGGEGKVDRIEVIDSHSQTQEQSPGLLTVTSRWLAHGSVSHWGHSHERHNVYQAKLSLRYDDHGGWKIVGMKFLDGKRLDLGTAS